MSPEEKNKLGHALSVEAAAHVLEKGHQAGLSWTELALCLESTIVVGLIGCAELSGMPTEKRQEFVQEMVETLTERAHSRCVDYFQKAKRG